MRGSHGFLEVVHSHIHQVAILYLRDSSSEETPRPVSIHVLVGIHILASPLPELWVSCGGFHVAAYITIIGMSMLNESGSRLKVNVSPISMYPEKALPISSHKLHP